MCSSAMARVWRESGARVPTQEAPKKLRRSLGPQCVNSLRICDAEIVAQTSILRREGTPLDFAPSGSGGAVSSVHEFASALGDALSFDLTQHFSSAVFRSSKKDSMEKSKRLTRTRSKIDKW